MSKFTRLQHFGYGVGASLWMFLEVIAWGQTASISQVPAMDSTLQSILQQKSNLVQQEQTLIAQGATTQAIAKWHQQNAAQFDNLNQQLQAWSKRQPQQPMPIMPSPIIPPNATPEMKEFLTNRVQLANSLAQLKNQSLTANATSSAAIGASTALEDPIAAQWRQQNAALIQRQQLLEQTISQQQEQTPMPTLAATHIPANAPPQLKAFLAARDALAQEEIQLYNQYATASSSTRQAALLQWHQQNAAKLQKLQQLSQALSQSTTTTQNNLEHP